MASMAMLNNQRVNPMKSLIAYLVGGAITILKNDGVRQWGWDYPIYHGKKKCLKPPASGFINQ